MKAPLASSGFFAGLFDFILLAGAGIASWWLVDWAVPVEWCAGGRWDALFLLALLPLFFARFLKPPLGRVRWMQSVLLAGCAAVATPAAVLTGRLIGGCTDVEGRVGGLVVLPHLVVGTAIGLAAAAVWVLLAARLPGGKGQPTEVYPDGAGRAMASVAAISSGLLVVLAWPDLVDVAATALLDGYCADASRGGVLYALVLILLYRGAQDCGMPTWRALALAGLAGIALVSVADVAAGLTVACPPAGEVLESKHRALRIIIRSVGFGFALVIIVLVRRRYGLDTPDEAGSPG